MTSRDEHGNHRTGGPGEFASTHWSLVLAAGEQGGDASRRALEKLCRSYWPPLYAYVRRRVADLHEAHDLTQAFFDQLLEKQYLAEVDPARGRFRAFLITAFRHFLSKEWDKARALKRGHGRLKFSLDFTTHDAGWQEPSETGTAERLYERRWALTLLNRVMDRLQREMERGGKGRHFAVLKNFIGGNSGLTFQTAADELGIAVPAARMAASRLRNRYRELLREEIAQTVSSEADIDDEIRHLFHTFSD